MGSSGFDQNEALYYATLLEFARSISSAPSALKGIETLYELLKQHLGLIALILERSVDGTIQRYPYGDMNAIGHMAQDRSPDEHVERRIAFCPLRAGEATDGITFLLPALDGDPGPLLAALALLAGTRFRLDSLEQRADQVEASARRRISEAAALYAIGQVGDSAEQPHIHQLIVERTALLMDAEACSLLLSDSSQMTFAAGFGPVPLLEELASRMRDGMAGGAAQTEQPILLMDRDAGHSGPMDETGSSIFAPLRDQSGALLGAIGIRRRWPAPAFTTDDLQQLAVFAAQSALAMTNRQLYDDLNRRATELQKLTTLSRTLISTTDLDALLENVVDEVCNVLDFERCCVYMRDAMRPHFVARVWRGYPVSIMRNPMNEKEGAIGYAARTGRLVAFDGRDPVDPAQERDRAFLQLRGFSRSLGTVAFVAVPIMGARSRCMGVLIADRRGRPELITAAQKHLLAAFVNQIGIAVDNSMIYQQMQETVANLRRLKDYTDRVIHSLDIGILSMDSNAVVTRWNRAAMRTLNQSVSSLQNAQLADLLTRMGLPEAERGQLLHMVRRAQETGENLPRIRMTLHPSERAVMTIYLMMSYLPRHGQDGGGVIMIFEDVTEEVRLEGEMEKMRRLADIGQFAARMAHEVRNTLSPIRGAAQIIRSELVTQGISTEWPDIIVSEVDGLSHLTSEMLNFARPATLEANPIDVAAFLENAIQSLSSYLEEAQVQVDLQIEPDLPVLMADRVQLGQMVRNLVMNAAQAMSGGGTLRVGARHYAEADQIRMEFRDNGEGISSNNLESIFRPFVTTRAKGTGLGLPIVQKIVDQHAGRVEVESRIGSGAAFRVILPCRQYERNAYEEALLSRPSSPREDPPDARV